MDDPQVTTERKATLLSLGALVQGNTVTVITVITVTITDLHFTSIPQA